MNYELTNVNDIIYNKGDPSVNTDVESTPLKVARKLDFNTGWFSQKTKSRKKILEVSTKTIPTITLVLKNGHYRFIHDAELLDRMDECRNKSLDPVECSHKSLPCLVLPFVSDRMENELRKLQKEIFPSKVFNIAFKNDSSIKSLIKPVGTSSQAQMVEEKDKVSGVVYKMRCKECEKLGKISTYIGETGRTLQT